MKKENLFKPVYLLFERDEGSEEMWVTGVFSSRALAEKAHAKFEEHYPPHWPQEWFIRKTYIDYQMLVLRDHAIMVRG